MCVEQVPVGLRLLWPAFKVSAGNWAEAEAEAHLLSRVDYIMVPLALLTVVLVEL
jgi:hypothetical protein